MAGDTSGVLQLATNGSTTALTIDTSQNVGIGTTTVASGRKLQLEASGDTIQRINSGGASSGLSVEFANNGTLRGGIGNGSGNISGGSATTFAVQAVNELVFASGGYSERMRIDSSGNVLIGNTSFTSLGYLNVQSATTKDGAVFQSNATGDTTQILFRNPNGIIGKISTLNSATSYVTSSDYRLKENIAPMTGALDKVAQLKPVTYKWKIDGSDGQGFIAHELAEVIPDCVSGEKDAVDAEGNPSYQGVDTSFLVATLTAAIQEQQTIINDLKARITALEGAA
jgi:hypothetical protein